MAKQLGTSKTCRYCKFWRPTADAMKRGAAAQCRRFPTPVDTVATHYCGEFQRSANWSRRKRGDDTVVQPSEPKPESPTNEVTLFEDE